MTFCCFPPCCGKRSKSKRQKTVHPIHSNHPGMKNTHLAERNGFKRGQIPEPKIPSPTVNTEADKIIGSDAAPKELKVVRIDNGCAPVNFRITKSLTDISKNDGVQVTDKLKHQALSDPGPSRINLNPQQLQQTMRQGGAASTYAQQGPINLEGKKNPGKSNTQRIGIQIDPEGPSTKIPVKLCNNYSDIPGSKDLILRVDTTTNHLTGIRIRDSDTQVDFLIVGSEDQGVKEPAAQQKPHAAQATAYVHQDQNSFDTYNDSMVNDIREEMGPIEFNHLASSWMKFW